MPHSTSDESTSASGSNDTTSPAPTTNGTRTPAASSSTSAENSEGGSYDEDFSLGPPLDTITDQSSGNPTA
ncbi:hypothetical protein JCM24511_01240 [Saitozyma sp. JCM 24511]|nr:hypothetical protein JCM24511_01240 [Saitozyma sp. JCM 24511]